MVEYKSLLDKYFIWYFPKRRPWYFYNMVQSDLDTDKWDIAGTVIQIIWFKINKLKYTCVYAYKFSASA